MEWRAFVLKAKTKPGILFTDNGDLFTIRLVWSEITRPAAQGKYSRHVRESGFRTRGNFRLWTDSGIQEILLWNPKSLGFGFRNTYNAGLESGLQYLESGIHDMESKIQDCLGFHGAKVSRVSGFPWMDSSDTNVLKLKLVQWDVL